MNKFRSKICIIGMPGSGKTTIGKLLAQKINYTFVDLDEEIEKKQLMKISEIFEKFGENYFRDKERDTLLEFIKNEKVVISTGGGIILKNQDILSSCYNIYLDCDIETLIKRTARNKLRPLLLDDRKRKIKELFNQRKSIYNDLSDLTINASISTKDSMSSILEAIPNEDYKKNI